MFVNKWYVDGVVFVLSEGQEFLCDMRTVCKYT